ncbi:MAG: hypothetical protein AAB800_00625 [Patescibacteria group bacterium]
MFSEMGHLKGTTVYGFQMYGAGDIKGEKVTTLHDTRTVSLFDPQDPQGPGIPAILRVCGDGCFDIPTPLKLPFGVERTNYAQHVVHFADGGYVVAI